MNKLIGFVVVVAVASHLAGFFLNPKNQYNGEENRFGNVE